MKIRNVVAADRPKILELLKKVRLFNDEEISCAMELLEIYLSNASQKDYDFFCCVDAQENVLGFVCYGKTPLTDAVYDLYWIAVENSTQNRGVGKTLLTHLDDILLTKGARMLLVETSSKISYGKTRAFYLKNGLVEISRIPDFYAENDDKIVFAKFYSLYERRRKNQWGTLANGPIDFSQMQPIKSGTIGTGRLETASGH